MCQYKAAKAHVHFVCIEICLFVLFSAYMLRYYALNILQCDICLRKLIQPALRITRKE